MAPYQKVLLIICVVIAPRVALCQDNMLSFQHLTVKNGLSQSSVVAIAQDSTGFMWFATQDGLNRYDGHRFIYYEKYFDDKTNTQNNSLGKIYIDRQGGVWIIPNTHVPERYNSFTKTFSPVAGLKDVSCMLHNSKGSYWFASFAGQLLLLQNNNTVTAKAALPGSVIYQLHEDSGGHLWVAASTGIYIYNSITNRFTPVKNQAALTNVYSVAEDHNNTIWAGTLGNGLFYKTKHSDTFTLYKTGIANLPPEAGLIIESLAVDKENNIWAGTYGNGLIVIKNGSTATQYLPEKSNPFSFSYKDVLTIFKSRDDVMWLGTDGGGINIFDKNYTRFQGFTSNSVPTGIAVDIVRAIYVENKQIWLGTSGKGLTRYNPGAADKWKTWLYEKDIERNGNGTNRVMSLYNNYDDLLWIGTRGNGIIWFSKLQERFIFFNNQHEQAYPDNTVWCLYPGDSGRVWAGTENKGLCLLDKNRKLLKQVDIQTDNHNSAPVKNIRCIETMNDTILWIGTDENGLYSYHTLQNTVAAPVFPGNHRQKLLKIKCLYYDKKAGILYIGTNGNGMAAYNHTTGTLTFYNTQQGLPNNVVYGIVPDETGLLWLSTNKGLASFAPPAGNKTFNVRLYDEKDGLQNTEFNTGAYFKDSNGVIYFGGIDGINYFSPGNITNISTAGKIVFTACTVAGKVYGGDSAIETKQVLVLKPGDNEFSLSFALLNYSAPRQITYQYRLEGYDKRWVSAGPANGANYTNLSPGTYRMMVTASADAGINLTKPAILTIVVKPHFYQTLWFKILAIGVLCVLVYWFVYWRINSVRKQEQLKQMRTLAEMKALRAQMNPHFIFNCLNAIDNLIQTDQKDKATVYLARFAKLIRNVLDSSKNNIVPFNKDVETLQLYLSLEQFRLSNKFSYELHADDELLHADYKVPPMIIQPFVENAIHHGLMNKATDDRKLTVLMQLENDFIRYTITDNGVGRKTSAAINTVNKPGHISYGINISQERAKLHNNHHAASYELQITDLEENGEPRGTKVEMWIAV
ncbi:ligand-binding sensor domain-containing protein [Foetidibacter luteolus]|uniref:ligand-binding sensor domain-containing protein n=1 Tax=Foetidibacter luteolus TaxID=2608880 RepID=UPI00129B1546|nr:two-component regulator propeller domain-containing protein [Foetidibacter luteolus]